MVPSLLVEEELSQLLDLKLHLLREFSLHNDERKKKGFKKKRKVTEETIIGLSWGPLLNCLEE